MFKKIPKDKWMKFSDEEKEYHTLEYKKAFELNKRMIIISTRIIALLCVIALFFIGFAMLKAVKEYGQIKDEYGDEAFCYLCGLESKKRCECVYHSRMYPTRELSEDYSIELAEYNAAPCTRTKIIGSQGNVDVTNQFNFSEITIIK